MKSQEVTKTMLAVSQGVRQLENRFTAIDLTQVIVARNNFYRNINERLRAVEEQLAREPIDAELDSDRRRMGSDQAINRSARIGLSGANRCSLGWLPDAFRQGCVFKNLMNVSPVFIRCVRSNADVVYESVIDDG